MARSSIPHRFRLVRNTERATRVATALVGVLLSLAAGLLCLQPAGWGLVSLSYDLPFVIHRAGSSDDIRIVYLDDLDGEFLDRKPQAQVLDQLAEAGARAVIYDVIFDRESSDPGIDHAFADAMRRFRGVDENGERVPGTPQRWIFLACGRRTFQVSGASGEELIPPNNTLLDAADDFGLVAYDDDVFVARKLTTGSIDEGSLTWKAANALGAALPEESRLDPRWINFAAPPGDPAATAAFPSCSASSLLRGDVKPGYFFGKVVLIGGEPGIVGDALGKDLFSTPFHRFRSGDKLPLMSGVELQANTLENLLRTNSLTRTAPPFEMVFITLAALIAGIVFSVIRPAHAIWMALLSILLLVTAGVFSLHFARVWFPWTVTGFLQIPVALVWGSSAHFYVERFFRLRLHKEQLALRAAFAKYVSPPMLDRLTKEGFQMKLGGETVEAAMMFTDIESFTDMCERVGDPEFIVHNLNDYFERTTRHIFEHDGVVIKFIGDAIFAAWGAPLPDPNAAKKATEAAWNVFCSSKLSIQGEELRTRIGLHVGSVVAGNIGSAQHVDYSVIGDAVNLAARLEGLNKPLGTSILLSDDVVKQLDGGFLTRRIGKFRVKGRQEPTDIHELLGPGDQEASPSWASTYRDALAALESGDLESARTLFTQVDHERSPKGDGPSRFFLDALSHGDITPEGIVVLTVK